MATNGGVSREHNKSIQQKIAFWFLHLTVVMVCGWIVFWAGWEHIGGWFGQDWHLSDPTRATILFGCAAVYFLRHGITLFYLLARQITWSEALGLIVFMCIFEIGLLVIGGGALRPYAIDIGVLDGLAAILFVVGSWLNSWSEIQRKLWKRKAENKGRCYTGGLFRHSMHINYFGDILLFTGWCLLTREPWTMILPLFMGLMFVFVHIPTLDAYLVKRYGTDFEDYARKTKRLIPYIW